MYNIVDLETGMNHSDSCKALETDMLTSVLHLHQQSTSAGGF
jgi:hypothetical protein